jgi:hypothetical protein
MNMDRRGFFAGALAAASLAGCAGAKAYAARTKVRGDKLYGALLHLGYNMWSDQPHPRKTTEKRRFPYPDYLTKKEIEKCEYAYSMGGKADFLRFDEGVWRRATERMSEVGMNYVMIDIGEGFVYPSHPEIAVRGAWDVAKMESELARLRRLGLEPIPKLNFSATHDAWMGDVQKRISTPEYYKFVSDVIADVCEVFKPRYFHIGYDEEDEAHQFGFKDVVVRPDETWWHDLLFTVGEVERHGARAWMWSDKIWSHREDFVKRCPKSVLQSNWYYLDDFEPKKEYDPKHKASLYPMVHAYEWLDEAGFDQVPCTSTVGGWGLMTVNARYTAAYCRKHVSPERLKGLMMASWTFTLPEFEQSIMKGFDQTGPAIELLGWNV